MTAISVERGDKVVHRVAPPPAAIGTVMAVFNDLQDRPCAAVQWPGGFASVSRLKWLIKR